MIKPYFSNKILHSIELLFTKKLNSHRTITTVINYSFINIAKDFQIKVDNRNIKDTLHDVLKVLNFQLSVNIIRKTKTNGGNRR